MKRDMELVRELLLKIADASKPLNFSDLVTGRRERAEEYTVAAYHMQMLVEEARLVRGIDASTMSGKDWIQLELTWFGQDFVDSIRDPTVWDHTKEGAKKLGGVSWDILLSLAKAYVKAEAKKRLNIDIG
jgi:hypothetical protein